MSEFSSSVARHRRAKGWSQAELAGRAGTSRSEVSGIETGRLVPSITVALALARALDQRVEDLFAPGAGGAGEEGGGWAWKPGRDPSRFWRASSNGRTLLYPAEATALGVLPHDGVHRKGKPGLQGPGDPDRTLVLAGCDPAVGLLAAELARAGGVRLLALTRSSRRALALLRDGLIHVAGVHLGGGRGSDNGAAAREALGAGCRLLHIARWQEGVALDPALPIRSIRGALRSRLRWVSREEGSGARQCLDRLFHEARARGRAGNRIARDHGGVAGAIRAGFAQAGVCVRYSAEEEGLRFLAVEEEDYDLCYRPELEGDPRITALAAAVRSGPYRRAVGALEGYDARGTGEVWSVS